MCGIGNDPTMANDESYEGRTREERKDTISSSEMPCRRVVEAKTREILQRREEKQRDGSSKGTSKPQQPQQAQ